MTDDPNLNPPPKPGEVTEFLRKSETEIRKRLNYKPLILRGALWIGIAMATDLRTTVKTWLLQDFTINWLQFIDGMAGCCLAGMIAWRLFLDQSVTRFHESNGKDKPL